MCIRDSPGTYTVSTSLDYRALVTKMQAGYDELTVKVTLTEGMTLKDIFATLEENGVCSQEELWEAAANYDFDYDFLSAETLGDQLRLEGYLFPDTYDFYTDSSALFYSSTEAGETMEPSFMKRVRSVIRAMQRQKSLPYTTGVRFAADACFP